MERQQRNLGTAVWKREAQRKLSPGRAVRSEQLDQGVMRYLEEERAEGRVVRNKDLGYSAKQWNWLVL